MHLQPDALPPDPGPEDPSMMQRPIGPTLVGLVLAIILAFLLFGCVSPPPREIPETGIEIPGEGYVADVNRVDGTVEGPWWQEFNDPGLTKLVDAVLAHNPTLEEAASRVEAAASTARMAGADIMPSVSAGANASRQQQVFTGINTGNGPLTSKSSTFGVSLDVSWEIDIWGRIQKGQAAALADWQASQSDLRGARLSLIAQAAKAWFGAVEAQLQRNLADATVQSYATNLDVIRSRFDQGVLPALDLRLAQANLASARALLHQRDAQLKVAVRQLEILAGRYPRGELDVNDDLVATPGPIPVGLPAGLLLRRPDLVSTERRLAASGMRVEEARAAMLPRLSFGAGVGMTGSNVQNLFDPDFFVWNIVGNLLAPIFQGNRLRNNVKLNEARAREVAFAYARTALQAFLEVESALAVEADLAARQVALTEAAEASTAARELAERQYTSGIVNLITLLDAQRRELSARSQLLSVRRERLDNRVDLHLALGGGLEADMPQIPEPTDDENRNGENTP